MTSDSKANVGLNILFVTILLLVFSMVGVLTYQVFDSLNSDIQNDDSLSDTTKETVGDVHERYPGTIDGAFATIFALFIILFAVLGHFSNSSPVLLIIPLIVLVATLVVAGIFSNTWETFTDDSSITFESSFPITDFVLDNYLVTILVAAVSVAVGRYVTGGGAL